MSVNGVVALFTLQRIEHDPIRVSASNIVIRVKTSRAREQSFFGVARRGESVTICLKARGTLLDS